LNTIGRSNYHAIATAYIGRSNYDTMATDYIGRSNYHTIVTDYDLATIQWPLITLHR